MAGSVSSEVTPSGSPRFGWGVGTVWMEIAAVGLLAMRGRHGPCGGSDRGWARFTGFVELLYFRLVNPFPPVVVPVQLGFVAGP